MNTSSLTSKVLIVVGIVIPIILLLLLFGAAFKVLLLILAAVLFASLFRGFGGFIHRHLKLPMGWSTLLSFVLIIGGLVLVFWFLIPRIGEQVNQLIDSLPQAISSTKEQLRQSDFGRRIVEQIPENPAQWLQEKSGVLKKSFGVFSATFGVLADLYIILFIGLFMLANPEPYRKGMIKLVPLSGRNRARAVVNRLGTTLKRWIAGKLFSMLVVAVLTAIGLWILGVSLPIALAVIAGLFAFVPNFGPIIALIPAVLIGFMQGANTALYVFLLYISIQVVESNLITPLVQKEMVYLPPAIILISQVLLGTLVGGLGLILATPIVAIAMVLIKMLYVEDVLGDQTA